jgi:hypothetical protein
MSVTKAVTKKMRVVIPRNPADLIALQALVYAKHLADGANSLLKNMQDRDWAIDGPKVAQAKAKHDEAEALKLKMEKAYRDRDLLLVSTTETLLASRDILTGALRSNMKRMGDWGFTVDDTPKAKKKSV